MQQQRLPDEIVRAHEHLTTIEQELGKQRDSLIREYQSGGATSTQQLYGSYYPMLERFKHLQEQYAAELSKFKTGLQQAVDPNQSQTQTNNTSGQVQQAHVVVNNNIGQQQTVITNPNNNITNNSQSRKIANVNQNGNNYGGINGINGINDDAKQPDNITNNTAPSSAQQPASTDAEMKVSVDSIYQQGQGQAPRGRKPPLGSTNSNNVNVNVNVVNNNNNNINNSASMTIPVQPQQAQQQQSPPQQQQQQQQQQAVIDRGQMNASQIVQSPSSVSQQQQIAAPQRLPQRKAKKISVQRHRYKYEGRGFDIWSRNLKRPIYTSTTIRINDSFRGNEKAAKQFLRDKGGLKEQLIEQVQFIDPKNSQNQRGGRGRGRNQEPRSMKKFTIVRVRCSLQKIKECVDRIKNLPEFKDNPDIIRKQNNRPRTDRNQRGGRSKKLKVSNFDILNKNTHKELTDLFLKFGDLEQDIFIGRDQYRRNPYAFVVFRNVSDAEECVKQHNGFGATLYFPPKKDNNFQFSDQQSPRQSVYMNRKLHIEFNTPNNNNNNSNNSGNRGQGRRGGRRGGGRGGGRGRGRR